MGRPVRSGDVDWSIIFDLIASEYSYTWKQFIKLTYKQLNIYLEAIARRNHNKTAVLASMHGIKIDLYKRIKPVSKQTLENARKEAYKILKQKQKAAQNGKR